MASDVAGLLEHLGLRDVALIGFSMSGPVAVRLGIEKPDIVTSLILVSSILPSSGRPRNEGEERLQRKEHEVLKARGIEGWAEAMNLRTGPLVGGMFEKNPEAASLWERVIARNDPHHLACMMEARLATKSLVDWRSRLKEVRQKTLVVAGSLDERFIDASRHLAREIPNATLEIIDGAGHMVNIEEPDKFNRAVEDFL